MQGSKRNKKLDFLFKQPLTGRVMRAIDFAWVLSESEAKRAFFVETLFEPKRPSYFHSKDFGRTYGFTLRVGNLNYYAKDLAEKQEACKSMFNITKPLFAKTTEKISHKNRLWVNSRYSGSLVENTLKIIDAIYTKSEPGKYSTKNFKCFTNLGELKRFIFKDCFGNLDAAFNWMGAFVEGEDYFEPLVEKKAKEVLKNSGLPTNC